MLVVEDGVSQLAARATGIDRTWVPFPALGYSEGQLADPARTVAGVPCDLVLAATPVDLAPLTGTGKRC